MVSRKEREYAADSSAAELVGVRQDDFSALKTLSLKSQVRLRIDSNFEYLEKKRSFRSLFSSHPSIESRIDSLLKNS